MEVMEVVEAPVRTEIAIEPNEVQKALLKMRAAVEGGRWCRNQQISGEGSLSKHCMLGLINYRGRL